MDYTGERVVSGSSEMPADIYKEHLERYSFALDFIKNKKVLDIACGTGYGSKLMAEAGAEKVVGGDIEEGAIREAQALKRIDNLDFLVVNAMKMPFAEKEFDIVVSFETIEHLSNPEKFIKEIARVLKSGGYLILSTPNRIATKKIGIDNPFHLREFAKREIAQLLSDYFGKIEIFGQRPLSKMNAKQKIIQKAYFLYTKIKWLEFLKRWFNTNTRQAIGKEIIGLEDDFHISEMKPGREYLYYVAVGKKK